MSFVLLASRSPRRKQLLQEVGFALRIRAADIEEHSSRTDPIGIAKDIAQKKGVAVVAAHPDLAANAMFTIASDTVVWTQDGTVFGKPRDRQHARQMLHGLMGKPHAVTTAFALFNGDRTPIALEADTTRVHMDLLTPSALDAYLDTDEPWDKAGAYGIQGLAGAFVSRIEGSWHTVVGLPIHAVLRHAHTHGLIVRMPWETEQ